MLQRVKPRLAAISLLIRNVVLKSVANSQRAPREILKRAVLTPTGGGAASTVGQEKPARTHTCAGNFRYIAPAAQPNAGRDRDRRLATCEMAGVIS